MRTIDSRWLVLFVACASAIAFLGEGVRAGQVRVEGRYVNAKYLYSVDVPNGLLAYRMEAPAPNHGIAIYFSRSNEDYAWVNAGFDATGADLQESTSEAARALSAKYGLTVVGDSARDVWGLHAREVVMRGGPSGNGVAYARLLLAQRSLPDGKTIIYTVGLQTKSRSDAADHVFARVVASLKLTPIG